MEMNIKNMMVKYPNVEEQYLRVHTNDINNIHNQIKANEATQEKIKQKIEDKKILSIELENKNISTENYYNELIARLRKKLKRI